LLALAARADGARPRVRLRVAAAATVRSDETLPAALVDAAWRSRPGLVDACLDELPAAARTPGRIAFEIDFEASGAPRRVTVGREGHEDLGTFPGCVESHLKAGLRVPGISDTRGATARLELLLAVRR
jgi:hypothetical protein